MRFVNQHPIQREFAGSPKAFTSYPPDPTGQEGGMSFPKKGKSFPKKGKSFPKRSGGGGSDFSLDDHAFAMKIASALTSELKDRNSRVKLVAGWTGAHERTVKNWILGRYAPSRQTPCGTGAALRCGLECHPVDGGSAGFAASSKGRGPEAKGVRTGGPHRRAWWLGVPAALPRERAGCRCRVSVAGQDAT
jgi:hypothetical protein